MPVSSPPLPVRFLEGVVLEQEGAGATVHRGTRTPGPVERFNVNVVSAPLTYQDAAGFRDVLREGTRLSDTRKFWFDNLQVRTTEAARSIRSLRIRADDITGRPAGGIAGDIIEWPGSVSVATPGLAPAATLQGGPVLADVAAILAQTAVEFEFQGRNVGPLDFSVVVSTDDDGARQEVAALIEAAFQAIPARGIATVTITYDAMAGAFLVAYPAGSPYEIDGPFLDVDPSVFVDQLGLGGASTVTGRHAGELRWRVRDVRDWGDFVEAVAQRLDGQDDRVPGKLP